MEYVGIDEDEGSSTKQKNDKILIEQARALIDSGTKANEIYNLLDKKLTRKQIYNIQSQMRRYSKQNKNMDDNPNSTIYKRNDSQVILCDQCSKVFVSKKTHQKHCIEDHNDTNGMFKKFFLAVFKSQLLVCIKVFFFSV